MKAVHFGAGNIGRGFVGLLLHDAGYEVVFADVNAELIDALAASDRYTVHEVGVDARDRVVDGYRAREQRRRTRRRSLDELTTADIATTAVGPTILRFIAPHLVMALRERPADAPPLAIMACENAINATDLLRDEIASLSSPEEWPSLAAKAIFANTAVDRIVPGQAADAGLDVTVETFFEWAIERPPFGDDAPDIPGAHFVDDLAPYIERKLFTVNTGHASTAYFGFVAGHARISDALADPAVAAAVERVLAETSALIVAKHDFTEAGAGAVPRDDPRAVPQPRAARHRRARRTPAAAQARPARALHRPGRRARRDGAARRRAARRHRCGAALRRPGRPRERRAAGAAALPRAPPRSCTRSPASARGIRSNPASSTSSRRRRPAG